MLDINLIRENPEIVRKSLRDRQMDPAPVAAAIEPDRRRIERRTRHRLAVARKPPRRWLASSPNGNCPRPAWTATPSSSTSSPIPRQPRKS